MLFLFYNINSNKKITIKNSVRKKGKERRGRRKKKRGSREDKRTKVVSLI